MTDPSISRHHAEIRRDREGSFRITDLDSLNGLFVNGKKSRGSALSDGDLVEVGDVAMKFTVEDVEDTDDEETVMLHTVMPSAPLDETLVEPGKKRA